MTIFRENWKDIPEIIQFCNQNKCSVFFSYLHKPEEMSLWTLPPKEINEISYFLKNFSFSKNNAIEIYNSKCYNEIIEHLHYWDNPEQAEIIFQELSLYIKSIITELGYEKHKSKIYKELQNIDFEQMIKFYNENSKEEQKEKMKEFLENFKK